MSTSSYSEYSRYVYTCTVPGTDLLSLTHVYMPLKKLANIEESTKNPQPQVVEYKGDSKWAILRYSHGNTYTSLDTCVARLGRYVICQPNLVLNHRGQAAEIGGVIAAAHTHENRNEQTCPGIPLARR